MAFAFFNNLPLSIGTQIGTPAYFTGDGTTQDFDPGVGFPYTSVNNLVQAGNAFYRKSTGGVTNGSGGSGNVVHLSSPPGVSVPIIVPPIQLGLFTAFDRAITGVTNPQDAYGVIYCGDIADIETQGYETFPGNTGIKIEFEDHAVGDGAAISWFELALLNNDQTVGTYQGMGNPVYLAHDIKGFNSLFTGATAGTNTVTLNSAAAFNPGQIVMIDPTGTFETQWVTSITGNTLTLKNNLAYGHSTSAQVFVCGTGVGVHMHVPTNVGDGITPQMLLNISINATLEVISQ